MMKPQKLDSTLSMTHYLSQLAGHKYLLLDGSRFQDIYVHLYEQDHNHSPEFVPLFKSTQFESILEVSPCLIRLNTFSLGLLPWFLESETTMEKGWLFTSDWEMADLVTHFQDCLIAQLPDSSQVLFRYYDPVILHFVADCSDPSTWQKLAEPFSKVIWRYKKDFYEADQTSMAGVPS